jgi:hypothetical protein
MADSTEVISVNCNHCGAPLQVSSGTRFLTCSYCGSQLAIHRSGGAFYTEVLQEIDARTQRIEQDVQEIKRQNAVEQLDREWEFRRQTFLVRRKDGSTHIPTTAGGIIGAFIAIVAGVAWMIFTGSMGAPAFFPLFGLIFIAAGVFGAISSMTKASGYEQAEAQYRLRRNQLLQQTTPPQSTEPSSRTT